ncbi:hypothetical protein EON63_09490 [archaeon]|nr:MAG: hypothetical protein EON63_09490 [archaeon]
MSHTHTCTPSTDFNSYGPVSIAETSAQRKNGYLAAPIEPGLGVKPRMEVLGDPVFDVKL